MTGALQLWIGPADPGSVSGRTPDRPLVTLAPSQVTAERLHNLAPAEILCPLTFGGGDAALVVALLAQAGWRGPVLVISPPLPAPAVVLSELAALGTGMDIRLLFPDAPPAP